MSRRNIKGEGDALALIIMAVIFAVIVTAVLGLARAYNSWSCDRYGTQTERQVRYDFLQDTCYVKTTAGWRARGEQRTLDNEFDQ